MCGLIFSTSSAKATLMVAGLQHRGPDATGVRSCGNGRVIAHTRLAIMDVTNIDAQQPLFDGSVYTVFNGELFNYKSLALGTEVQAIHKLLRGNHELSMLLSGYYAAIQYRTADQTLVLARDYFGVMPLFYSIGSSGEVHVASERKVMKDSGKIRSVPANSRVTIDLKTMKVKIHKYPEVLHLTKTPANFLQTYLLNAIEECATHASSGFAVALSGGLDSSILLAGLKSINAQPNEIITTYLDAPSDEVARAKELTAHLGWSSLHNVVKTQVMSNSDLRYHLETPLNKIRDFAFMRHATVAKHTKSKVILCGEGLDELGLGYPLNREFTMPHERFLKKVSLLKSQASMTLDRVNLAGMMYSKEYRVPFLSLDFVNSALGQDQVHKSVFRELAYSLGVPSSIINANKYSGEEARGRELLVH